MRSAPPATDNDVYFYLSYAHFTSTQPDEADEPPPDVEVMNFFNDLVAAVRLHATRQPVTVPGLYDQSFPAGADLSESIGRAVSRTQVLVELYSPRYPTNSWAQSTHDLFTRRLAQVAADPAERVISVLWIPVGTPDADAVARDLGDTREFPDYVENGLSALARFAIYHEQYEKIVELLAKRIVRVAEDRPLRAAPPAPLAVTRQSSTDAADFIIEVLAPSAGEVAEAVPDRRADLYGETPAAWRPFVANSRLSVAEFAASIVERYDMVAAVVDATTVAATVARKPTALFIDPWILSTRRGHEHLTQVIEGLTIPGGEPPDWVTAMVVTELPEDDAAVTRAGILQAEVVEMLRQAVPELNVMQAGSADEFDRSLPTLVTQTRRRYFRTLPEIYPPMPDLRRHARDQEMRHDT